MGTNLQETVYLFTFTKENLFRELHFSEKKMITIISPEAQITDTNQIVTMKKSEG